MSNGSTVVHTEEVSWQGVVVNIWIANLGGSVWTWVLLYNPFSGRVRKDRQICGEGVFIPSFKIGFSAHFQPPVHCYKLYLNLFHVSNCSVPITVNGQG